MKTSYVVESYRTERTVRDVDTLQAALSEAAQLLLAGAINVGISLPSGEAFSVILTASPKK